MTAVAEELPLVFMLFRGNVPYRIPDEATFPSLRDTFAAIKNFNRHLHDDDARAIAVAIRDDTTYPGVRLDFGDWTTAKTTYEGQTTTAWPNLSAEEKTANLVRLNKELQSITDVRELADLLYKTVRGHHFRGIYITLGGQIGAGKTDLLDTLAHVFEKGVLSKDRAVAAKFSETATANPRLVCGLYRGGISPLLFEACTLLACASQNQGILGTMTTEKPFLIVRDRSSVCCEEFLTFGTAEDNDDEDVARKYLLREARGLTADSKTRAFNNNYLPVRVFLHRSEDELNLRRQRRLEILKEEVDSTVFLEMQRWESCRMTEYGLDLNEHLFRAARKNYPRETLIVRPESNNAELVCAQILRLLIARYHGLSLLETYNPTGGYCANYDTPRVGGVDNTVYVYDAPFEFSE